PEIPRPARTSVFNCCGQCLGWSGDLSKANLLVGKQDRTHICSSGAAGLARDMSADIQQRVGKARRYLLSNQFAQALPLYRELVRQRPGEAVLWFEYGNAASGLDQADLAERAWTRAMELAPANAELIGLIGHQYQGLRKPDQALACFFKAAAADP